MHLQICGFIYLQVKRDSMVYITKCALCLFVFSIKISRPPPLGKSTPQLEHPYGREGDVPTGWCASVPSSGYGLQKIWFPPKPNVYWPALARAFLDTPKVSRNILPHPSATNPPSHSPTLPTQEIGACLANMFSN